MTFDFDLQALRDLTEIDFEEIGRDKLFKIAHRNVTAIFFHFYRKLVCVKPGAHMVKIGHTLCLALELAVEALSQEL